MAPYLPEVMGTNCRRCKRRFRRYRLSKQPLDIGKLQLDIGRPAVIAGAGTRRCFKDRRQTSRHQRKKLEMLFAHLPPSPGHRF
ncbi:MULTISPECIES: hypothetical protein [Mesorhizobium]|uniref:hypothetical protein n=1 Tax=Mesorhizobium sp. TaxID=1871066 RepID=UPI000FE74A70|nr:MULTISPECIES: hypothetical protein [Mesorhizobium]RWM74458.1 MAG: hypothetical protein EOR82_04255 [Mesorhizobium sp.]TIO21664.1 MAG: hypothetical protein E5X83_28955 [Mesorhizobium sp.]TJV63500.1 MAG: hypothetical protein E5X82_06525 [Mesorhizobium sp.]